MVIYNSCVHTFVYVNDCKHSAPNEQYLHSNYCSLLVEALRYNSERHRFDSRWCHWSFSLT